MKQPWEKGFIPKPGAKVQWKGPKVPEGWVRHDSTDAIRFERDIGFWTKDLIVGLPGRKWSLWFDHRPGVFRAPDMKMNTLEGLLAWYMVESETREPVVYGGTRTGRQTTKAFVHASYQNLPVQAASRMMREGAQSMVEAYRALGFKVTQFMDEVVVEVGKGEAAAVGAAIHATMETTPLFADFKMLEERVCKTLAK